MALSEGDRVKLKIRHRATISFSEPVSDPCIELHLSPVDTGLQRTWEHGIAITPDAPVKSFRDHFGNHVVRFQLPGTIERMEIDAHSTVETTHAVSCGPESAPDPRPYQERWQEFLHYSHGIPELAEYGSIEIPRPISMDMDDLEFGHRLHLMGEHFRDTFDYDPQASSVDPGQLFKDGKGSAQAIAHAMIGMLRQTGIPARFASGYVFNPAEGEMGEQLLGATSQHAWVQAWHEGYGWIGVDPVNAKLVGWQYVRTAIGRDYFDVVPSRMVSPADTEGSTETSIKVEIDESA